MVLLFISLTCLVDGDLSTGEIQLQLEVGTPFPSPLLWNGNFEVPSFSLRPLHTEENSKTKYVSFSKEGLLNRFLLLYYWVLTILYLGRLRNAVAFTTSLGHSQNENVNREHPSRTLRTVLDTHHEKSITFSRDSPHDKQWRWKVHLLSGTLQCIGKVQCVDSPLPLNWGLDKLRFRFEN